MACNCSSGTPLPPAVGPSPLEQDNLALIPGCGCVESGTCCDGPLPPGTCVDAEAIQSSRTCGANLENKWTDSACENEGVTLLGRVGKKLVRFTKSGFIQLVNGKAKVVDNIPIKVTRLWHRWTVPPGSSLPVLGAPAPYPYSIIADSTGVPHAIKGVPGKDASQFWNAELQQWEVRPISEIPICTRGQVAPLSGIELVGFKAIPVTGDPDQERCLSRLFGNGVVVLNTAASTPTDCLCEGCQAIPAESAIATLIPYPGGDETYTFKWDSVNGPHWALDI